MEEQPVHQKLMNVSDRSESRVCLFLRVSTDKQDHERQLTELRAYCSHRGFYVEQVISSVVSGSQIMSKRQDLKDLFKLADSGRINKVIVTEVSRIGRNAKDIWTTIRYLHARGISVVFKSLGGIESLDEFGKETFVTNVIISIYAELSQEERRILSNRIKSGLVHAKSKGKRLGRPEGAMSDDAVLRRYPKLVRDIKAGLSLSQCQKAHEVSRCTVIKVKRKIAGHNNLGCQPG